MCTIVLTEAGLAKSSYSSISAMLAKLLLAVVVPIGGLVDLHCPIAVRECADTEIERSGANSQQEEQHHLPANGRSRARTSHAGIARRYCAPASWTRAGKPLGHRPQSFGRSCDRARMLALVWRVEITRQCGCNYLRVQRPFDTDESPMAARPCPQHS